MGNQLVGIAPSQIYPVEHYLTGTFEPELQFEANMGSTRFFKVARVRSDEGPVVVKVFVKHDPSLPLEDHADRLEHIKKNLSSAMNCLPFQRVVLTDKAGYIMREFVKHSLYDRVSTRPFLTILEKKWITFQILCALNQCHKQKICHGDIKLENILITSWNWILLADFASFKPTYLPEDNPADYTYFFDTSRRRTCYIAPERFLKTMSSEGAQTGGGDIPLLTDSILPTESLVRVGAHGSERLLPEMDIFSAGCALLELWTEGTAPFEFSQLLAYHRGDEELVTKHLQGIENEHLRNLLSSMLHRNPKERKSAEVYLDQEKGRLFPEYFYSFLQSYLQMLYYSPTALLPDERIRRLHTDISHCITVLTNRLDNEINKLSLEIKDSSDHDGLILIITVVTSCIRGLKHCDSKICCLEMLQTLAEYATSETVLDRILPYILHLAQDLSARVQVQAMETLTVCLNMVKGVPRSDANIFPEYILPSIAALCTHSSVVVRVSYARNIAKLAKTAVYFLEESQRNSPNEMPARRYEAELNALHEIIQRTVSSLLTDPQPIVKQTLIESGIYDLCSFFGKQKANDVILSHMITFLNDKEDKNLRGSFFDCIVGVVGYIGWQASDILIPLLQQGLTDSEEFVIAKAIRATTALIDMGHIQKPTVTDFIKECACYLVHPNLWIRHEIVGLISTTARKLSTIDVQCKIVPSITSHLKCNIIQVERSEILLDCLNSPIPRNIFDNVLRYAEIHKFIKALEDRKTIRNKVTTGFLPQYEEMGTSLKNLFRRLNSEGLTEFIEIQLLSMQHFLMKLSKYKGQEPKPTQKGKIILSKKDIVCFEYPLADKNTKIDANRGKVRRLESEHPQNIEWQHVLGTMDAQLVQMASSPSNESITPISAGSPPSGSTQVQATPSSSLVEYSMPEKNFWQERSSECRLDLEKLRNKLKSRYAVLASNRDFNPSEYFSVIPSGWKMNGTLIAHLHEHSNNIVKLTPLRPYGPLFASGCLDGTVRLWDCNKLNGSQGINKSRQGYSANTPICALGTCDSGQTLAVGCEDGALLLLRIDKNSYKMTLQQALRSNGSNKSEPDEGAIVEFQAYEQNPNVLVYATMYGSIIALDTRMQSIAWRFQNEVRHGLTTTLCVDPTGSWLASGTSAGRHVFWDLRFRLSIAEIRNPGDTWIRKIVCHPTEPSCIISASHTNNEVSVWNIETGHRQIVLWASNAPALCTTGPNTPYYNAGLLPGMVDNSAFLITGSTDQRIRYWDLNSPKNCSLIVPSTRDNLADQSFGYDSRLIDGSRVIEESVINLATAENFASRSNEEQPRSGPDMPTPYHIDGITDLLMCKSDKQQIFIVSSSRDGVIKLWK